MLETQYYWAFIMGRERGGEEYCTWKLRPPVRDISTCKPVVVFS